MPPPQPGFFSYSDDTYSLEGIHAGQNLSRRRPRASASSSAQQQHQLNSQQRGGHQLLPQHQGGGGSSSLMDSGGMDYHHSLDRPVNARIIRGNGGNGRGLGNGVGGIGSSTSGSRNPPRQQDREISPENSATHNNLKRKREVQDRVSKYGKDRYEKRDEITASALAALTHLAHQLHQNPAETPSYALRLYPIALERAAMLHAVQLEEDQDLLSTEVLFEHEMKQIEDDFDKSRTRLRERVLEGLEERRRRAREEKEGEGVVSVEALEVTASALGRSSTNSGDNTPPFTLTASIPYGLSPDDLISPFPHSLTSIAPSNPAHHHPSGPGRKPRAGGGRGGKEALSGVSALALGKAIGQLIGCKEADIEHDMGNIRRAQKRRRAAVRAAGGVVG